MGQKLFFAYNIAEALKMTENKNDGPSKLQGMKMQDMVSLSHYVVPLLQPCNVSITIQEKTKI